MYCPWYLKLLEITHQIRCCFVSQHFFYQKWCVKFAHAFYQWSAIMSRLMLILMLHVFLLLWFSCWSFLNKLNIYNIWKRMIFSEKKKPIMICWLKTKQNIKMCIWTKEIEFFQGHLQQMFAVMNRGVTTHEFCICLWSIGWRSWKE